MAGNDNKRGFEKTPWLTFNGISDFISIPSTSTLQLSRFSIVVWFKTSKNYTPDPINGGEGMMITKGGWISNVTGEQLSYGLWISDANHLRGGFETTTGTDNILTTSGTTFNDGKWHHGGLTYDQSKLKIYTDGKLFKEMSTSAMPEINNIPLVIGKNPLTRRQGYFKGNLDEAKVWNRAISSTEITNMYTHNIVNRSGIVYETLS